MARSRSRVALFLAALPWAAPLARGAEMPALEALQGVWTTGPATSCRTRFYVLEVEGDVVRFRNETGRVDVERVVARRPDSLVTRTVESTGVGAGTQWEYRMTDTGGVLVRNLRTGSGFTLTRCPDGAASGTTPARQGRWSFASAPGGGNASLSWAERGDNHGTLYLSCAPDRRTFHLTVAAPELPEGRRVQVTFSAGDRSAAVQLQPEEGPVSNVGGDVPSGHPLLGVLRSEKGALRIRSAGREISVDLPLQDGAAAIRRFEASCRAS